MLRRLLCALGMHHPVISKTLYQEGNTETYYVWICARMGCKWVGGG